MKKCIALFMALVMVFTMVTPVMATTGTTTLVESAATGGSQYVLELYDATYTKTMTVNYANVTEALAAAIIEYNKVAPVTATDDCTQVLVREQDSNGNLLSVEDGIYRAGVRRTDGVNDPLAVISNTRADCEYVLNTLLATVNPATGVNFVRDEVFFHDPIPYTYESKNGAMDGSTYKQLTDGAPSLLDQAVSAVQADTTERIDFWPTNAGKGNTAYAVRAAFTAPAAGDDPDFKIVVFTDRDGEAQYIQSLLQNTQLFAVVNLDILQNNNNNNNYWTSGTNTGARIDCSKALLGADSILNDAVNAVVNYAGTDVPNAEIWPNGADNPGSFTYAVRASFVEPAAGEYRDINVGVFTNDEQEARDAETALNGYLDGNGDKLFALVTFQKRESAPRAIFQVRDINDWGNMLAEGESNVSLNDALDQARAAVADIIADTNNSYSDISEFVLQLYNSSSASDRDDITVNANETVHFYALNPRTGMSSAYGQGNGGVFPAVTVDPAGKLYLNDGVYGPDPRTLVDNAPNGNIFIDGEVEQITVENGVQIFHIFHPGAGQPAVKVHQFEEATGKHLGSCGGDTITDALNMARQVRTNYLAGNMANEIGTPSAGVTAPEHIKLVIVPLDGARFDDNFTVKSGDNAIFFGVDQQANDNGNVFTGTVTVNGGSITYGNGLYGFEPTNVRGTVTTENGNYRVTGNGLYGFNAWDGTNSNNMWFDTLEAGLKQFDKIYANAANYDYIELWPIFAKDEGGVNAGRNMTQDGWGVFHHINVTAEDMDLATLYTYWKKFNAGDYDVVEIWNRWPDGEPTTGYTVEGFNESTTTKGERRINLWLKALPTTAADKTALREIMAADWDSFTYWDNAARNSNDWLQVYAHNGKWDPNVTWTDDMGDVYYGDFVNTTKSRNIRLASSEIAAMVDYFKSYDNNTYTHVGLWTEGDWSTFTGGTNVWAVKNSKGYDERVINIHYDGTLPAAAASFVNDFTAAANDMNIVDVAAEKSGKFFSIDAQNGTWDPDATWTGEDEYGNPISGKGDFVNITKARHFLLADMTAALDKYLELAGEKYTTAGLFYNDNTQGEPTTGYNFYAGTAAADGDYNTRDVNVWYTTISAANQKKLDSIAASANFVGYEDMAARSSGTFYEFSGINGTWDENAAWEDEDGNIQHGEYVDVTKSVYKVTPICTATEALAQFKPMIDDKTYTHVELYYHTEQPVAAYDTALGGISADAADGQPKFSISLIIDKTKLSSELALVKDLGLVYKSIATRDANVKLDTALAQYCYITDAEADDRGVYYLELNEIHKPVDGTGKAPTCTETGLTAGTLCGNCGKVIDAQTVIGALGHKLTETKAVDATCTQAGNTAYWSCSVCGKFYADADGKTEVAKDSWVVNALGHTLTKSEHKAPTCTEVGIKEHWACSTCEKSFTDATCTTEMTAGEKIEPILGHEYNTETGVCENGCGTKAEIAPVIVPTQPNEKVAVVETTEDTTSVLVDKTVIEEISDNKSKVHELEIPLKDEITITLDKKTLDQVAQTGTNLAISGEKVATEEALTPTQLDGVKVVMGVEGKDGELDVVETFHFSANLPENEKGEVEFDGTVQVQAPYPHEVAKGKKVMAYYIGEDGKPIPIKVKYDPKTKTVVMELDHFSTYIITQVEDTSSGSSGGSSYVPSGHEVTSTLPGVDKVYVDGKLVDAKYYTVYGGNIVLSDAFLRTLVGGSHSVKLVYGDRQATGTFSVKTIESAKTFDAGIALYAGMALSSVLGAAYVMGKKKEN